MQHHLDRLKRKETLKRKRQQEKDEATSEDNITDDSDAESEHEKKKQERMFKKFNQLMSFKLNDDSRSMTYQNQSGSQRNMRLNLEKFQSSNSTMRNLLD